MLSVVNATPEMVTIESDKTNFSQAISELRSLAAKKLALEHATKELGLSNPGTAGMSGHYPVDHENKVVESTSSDSIRAYRIDIPVSGSFR